MRGWPTSSRTRFLGRWKGGMTTHEIAVCNFLPYVVPHAQEVVDRQQTMVDPAHQRKGVGRLLTQKCSKEADSRGAVTWVRARPKAASLFLKEGFEVVERINLDLAEHGAKGTTSFFVMKREPGARNDPSRKLDLE